MKDTIFLVFDRFGVKGIRKSVPSLKAGEYATRIDVSVDNKYFNRIIPIAKMEIKDNFLIEPKMELELKEEPKENSETEIEND